MSGARGGVDSSRFEKVVEGVYALAVWDASWNSYNNCYAVLGARDTVLIDTGKGEHVDLLIHALSRLQRTPRDVTTILATHGHHDHVGGSVAFAKASKVIHGCSSAATICVSLARLFQLGGW